MDMNGIDIGILIIVLGSGVIGLVRGLTREFLGLIGWVGAALAAFFSLPFLREIARQHITNPTIADGVTVLAVFIAFLVLFSLVSHLLSGYIKDSALGGVDRSLGLLYGAARGLILVCLAEMVLSVFIPRPKHAEAMQKSKLAPTVYEGSDLIASLAPPSVKAFFEDFVNERNTKRFTEHADMMKDNVLSHSNDAPKQDHMGDLERQFLKQPSSPDNSTPSSPRYRVENPDKTAEELARLKPRSAQETQSDEGKGYNTRDRNEMERLMLMNEDKKRAEQKAEESKQQSPDASPADSSARPVAP